MSNRGYKSRSTFDDPQGSDRSYQIGRGTARTFSEAFAEFAPGGSRGEPEAKRQNRQERPLPRYNSLPIRIEHYGYRSKKEAQVRMPKSRAVKRRSTRRRRPRTFRSSRVKRARRYGQRIRRSRRATVARLRRAGRGRRRVRRVVRRPSLKALQAKVVKENIMLPVSLTQEETACLAQIGDSAQNRCSWFIQRPLSPKYLDLGLQTASSLAITSVISTQTAFMEYLKYFAQYKNGGNHRVDVTVYTLFPRKDMPASFADMDGINPSYLSQAFTDVATSAEAVRLPGMTEHGADIFKTNLPKFFKIKQKLHKFLEPGEFFNMKLSYHKRMYTKAKFGVQNTNSSIAGSWDFLRYCGPMYAIRVQGPIVHNETKITSGAASFGPGEAITAIANQVGNQQTSTTDDRFANWHQVGTTVSAGTTYGVNITTGGYAVDVYVKRDMKFYYINTSTQTEVLTGSVSARLPTNLTRAEEKTYELVAPAEAAMEH